MLPVSYGIGSVSPVVGHLHEIRPISDITGLGSMITGSALALESPFQSSSSILHQSRVLMSTHLLITYVSANGFRMGRFSPR